MRRGNNEHHKREIRTNDSSKFGLSTMQTRSRQIALQPNSVQTLAPAIIIQGRNWNQSLSLLLFDHNKIILLLISCWHTNTLRAAQMTHPLVWQRECTRDCYINSSALSTHQSRVEWSTAASLVASPRRIVDLAKTDRMAASQELSGTGSKLIVQF